MYGVNFRSILTAAGFPDGTIRSTHRDELIRVKMDVDTNPPSYRRDGIVHRDGAVSYDGKAGYIPDVIEESHLMSIQTSEAGIFEPLVEVEAQVDAGDVLARIIDAGLRRHGGVQAHPDRRVQSSRRTHRVTGVGHGMDNTDDYLS